MPEFSLRWDSINSKLGQINQNRRFLVHGIGRTNFYHHSVKAFVPRKESYDLKEFSVDDIKDLSNQISHLLTGKDGLSGDFLIDFSTKRFDRHNRTTFNRNKIVYRVNNKILTEYSG
jgi:hypothetical protein